MWKLSVIVCVAMLMTSILQASTSTPGAGFQPAAITSVHRVEVTEPAYSGGDNPSDAPLESHSYAYDVGVKTACAIYVAHYESPYDYLPSAFAANHEIPMRLAKGTMQFDLGYRQVQLTITKHKKEAHCHAQ